MTRGEDLQDDGTWRLGRHFSRFDLTTTYQELGLEFMVDPGHAASDDFRLIFRHKNKLAGSELWIDEVTIRAR